LPPAARRGERNTAAIARKNDEPAPFSPPPALAPLRGSAPWRGDAAAAADGEAGVAFGAKVTLRADALPLLGEAGGAPRPLTTRRGGARAGADARTDLVVEQRIVPSGDSSPRTNYQMQSTST
jgi:hypothetical protein